MAQPRPGPPVVAILNTNDDIVEMLRMNFERAGLTTVSAHLDDARRGAMNVKDFIGVHDPNVIVYDLSPPYDQYWRFLEHLRSMPFMRDRAFVVTSTNVARALELANGGEPVFEIVGKPYDIDRLTDIVREAARARPTK